MITKNVANIYLHLSLVDHKHALDELNEDIQEKIETEWNYVSVWCLKADIFCHRYFCAPRYLPCVSCLYIQPGRGSPGDHWWRSHRWAWYALNETFLVHRQWEVCSCSMSQWLKPSKYKQTIQDSMLDVNLSNCCSVSSKFMTVANSRLVVSYSQLYTYGHSQKNTVI